MRSGEAFGWLVAGLINDHVLSRWDPEDLAADPSLGEDDTRYAPCCCGPCGAWHDWFSHNTGITDSYTRHLPDRTWIWMTADGGVDWNFMRANTSRVACPNHKQKEKA